MIMVRLMGGLGNQMFQYAFGRSLALKYQKELVLDKSLLLDKNSPHEVNTHRNYDLDIFTNLKFRWATPQEIFLFNGNPSAGFFKKILRKLFVSFSGKKLIIQKNNSIHENYFEAQGDVCFAGRWQSYKFFEENASAIAEDFVMEAPAISGLENVLKQITALNSVCLHVRRGDLITSPLYSKTIGAHSSGYYNRAMDSLNSRISNPHYFIFSDDPEWCKTNLPNNENITVVNQSLSGKKSEGHFYLMKSCKHFIISNSTFAWWAAYLASNKNKMIVYPKKWYIDPQLSNPKMCPAHWTKI